MPKPLSVVIIDDSPIVRARLITLLAPLEDVTIVGQAADVPEGLDVVGRLNPDVVILDLQLRSGSGIAILRHVRAAERRPHTIVLTNHSSQQIKDTCTEAGADFFFDKSTEFENVTDICLQLRGAR